MFAWLEPKCPLDTGEKMWIEFRCAGWRESSGSIVSSVPK